MARKWEGTAGLLLLGLAVLLDRTVASRTAEKRNRDWRDAALRAAYRRGVPVTVLASRTRLTQGWVKTVVTGGKPPPVDEAA
ncbi:hypothetical protein ACFFKE_33070 [Streptomyces mutabilis]|uniref:Helix-turn-helix domain-containing protein n=1 Tax=Streptomyces mutabilis TaxID=67332 RepID=A0A086MUY9_9ACTN|nr:hypothetical protein [Streptomyces mutabilis]KFG72707.1 hypothetical protein FM21_17655 [Streptomyces mutabilis]